MVNPNKIEAYEMEGLDRPTLFVARDKKNRILAEFEMKNGSHREEVKQDLNNNLSSDGFWDKWESYAKKNRV